jgi:hypothetical protein
MADCRFVPLGGVPNRMLRRRSIVRPKFSIKCSIYTFGLTHTIQQFYPLFSLVDYGGIATSSARGYLRLKL